MHQLQKQNQEHHLYHLQLDYIQELMKHQLAVMTGAVTSAVHVAVRDVVEVLPQASLAVNVLV